MNLCIHKTASILLATLALALSPACLADDLVWTTGRVVNASGAPVRDATVAVYDSKDRVVDYVRTDANGEYTLAIPQAALNLPKKRGGLLDRKSVV